MTLGRLGRFTATLEGLKGRSRGRGLEPRLGLDFASNDYLALAGDPRMNAALADALARGARVGSGGSRLLRGNDPEHEALEEEAARFFGAPACLFFASGFDANLSVFSTLPRRGDLIVHDTLIHASVHAGMQAGKAEIADGGHNDPARVEAAITAWRAAGGTGIPFIAVESIYSMDGDAAPLAELVEIAERHEGFLVVDEAHATGVFGPDGRGLAAPYEGRDAVVCVHTCGKALGVSGALVTGARPLIDFLVNRARPFIYATSPSPLVAAGVRAALRILKDEPERRARLAALVQVAEGSLFQRLGVPPSGSQIIPVLLRSNARAAQVAALVRARGYDCRAIRPPTVPEGTARLRVSITLNVDAAAVTGLVDAIAEAMEAVPA